jgi:CheY-like chemotaxis protein
MKKKILILDDELTLTEMLMRVVEMMGNRPRVFNHPEDALDSIRRSLDVDRKYDLAIFDFDFHKSYAVESEDHHRNVVYNGISLAKVVYNVDPELPIVLASGNYDRGVLSYSIGGKPHSIDIKELDCTCRDKLESQVEGTNIIGALGKPFDVRKMKEHLSGCYR